MKILTVFLVGLGLIAGGATAGMFGILAEAKAQKAAVYSVKCYDFSGHTVFEEEVYDFKTGMTGATFYTNKGVVTVAFSTCVIREK